MASSQRKKKSSTTPTTTVLIWLCWSAITFYLGLVFSSHSSVLVAIHDEQAATTTTEGNSDAPRLRQMTQQKQQLLFRNTDTNQTLITLHTKTADDSTSTSTPPRSLDAVVYNQDDNNNDFACQGFFTIMSSAFIPGEDKVGLCTDLYNGRYRPLLEDSSRQFLKMNTTLTLFTTWTDEQLTQEPGCNMKDLPGIRTQQFDPVQLLAKHGYTQEQIQWMQGWHTAAFAGRKKLSKSDRKIIKHQYSARLADVWRVLLAKEYRMAYADLDMMYLSVHKEVYLKEPNVAVPVWSDELGAFEMQNSGFCFLPQQLDVLIRTQHEIIQSKGPSQAQTEQYKKYTALGPMIFQRSIQEMLFHGPIRLYLTNSNNDAGVGKVIKKHQQYKFLWLHLDSRFRGANMVGLREKFQELRDKCIPPTLEQVLPNYSLPTTTTTTTTTLQ